MNISDFDYHLPEELIARYPLPERCASRLLHVSRLTGEIQHKQFKDLIDLLEPGDLLVFNNTRVMPARLFAKKTTGGQCEILIERLVDQFHAWSHIRASKSPKPGSVLWVNNIELLVEKRKDDLFLIKSTIPLFELLSSEGHMPLPTYVKRADEKLDQERYQTVYAKILGAVAAPTAGLHFDELMLQQLQKKGIKFAYLTLHVGAGTFQPIRVENILEHKMHDEWAEISPETCEQILQTKAQGKRVIAVGTTSARTLETAALKGKLVPFKGETNLFIYPGFKFQVIDALLTNFHLPKSTLLLLVSAFATRDIILNAYQEAITHQYRFFSYGDAMLLHN